MLSDFFFLFLTVRWIWVYVHVYNAGSVMGALWSNPFTANLRTAKPHIPSLCPRIQHFSPTQPSLQLQPRADYNMKPPDRIFNTRTAGARWTRSRRSVIKTNLNLTFIAERDRKQALLKHQPKSLPSLLFTFIPLSPPSDPTLHSRGGFSSDLSQPTSLINFVISTQIHSPWLRLTLPSLWRRH